MSYAKTHTALVAVNATLNLSEFQTRRLPNLKEVAKLNNRQRMRATNAEIREWLLANGYDDVWFKPHTARNDVVYCRHNKYYATDLWNLFDGICFDYEGNVVFLQMKTNSWAKAEPIRKFLESRKIKVMVFNYTNKLKSSNGKWEIYMREYQ